MSRPPLLIVGALLTTRALLAQVSAPPAREVGDAVAGKRAFVEYACYYCHGTAGQGGLPAVGPRIARVARSYESFAAYVRRPSGRMSAYSDSIIADAALADIYAYLRSLPEPSIPPAALRDLLRRR
jgi:mono/diheme cytochrome c family protein